MQISQENLIVRLAQNKEDLKAAQRLRYAVFVCELGSGGHLVDHEQRLEMDEYDAVCDHLLLIDPRRNVQDLDHVVGVYRLLKSDDANGAGGAGGYYSEAEYDLAPLKNSGKRLLELGRSCIDKAYRGGNSMLLLWQGLSDYILENNIEILFGVASFHGTDVQKIAPSLSLLYHRFLAPPGLRVAARKAHFQEMSLIDPAQIDRVDAMVKMPALIKAYLRLGGTVGDGAFVDHAFNTIDICMIIDTSDMQGAPQWRRLHGQSVRGPMV